MIKTILESEIINILSNYDPSLQFPDYDRGLILRSDMEVMLRLLKATNSKTIFEFGTWANKTTKILSYYIEEIYTLDIDKESTDVSTLSEGQIGELLNHNDIGNCCKDKNNVKQFYGDSGVVEVMKDVRNYIGKQVDSCFVDANHSYKYVLTDTLQALAIVKPNGLIIWHDIKDEEGIGIIKALSILPFIVYHVEGTWIGFYINGD
jgi:hypothetical protein